MSEITHDVDALVEEFDFLDDWEERYAHVIALGKELRPLEDGERSEPNKVKGCVSQVWLVTGRDGDRLTFRGDSDAHIVRGLVAVLIGLFSNRRPEEILSVDPVEVFGRIGLAEHLSPQRSNGLRAMAQRIRKDALTAQAEAAA
ncbi:MAG: SufE family protein [Maricaulaceae bacterium]